MNDTGSSIVSLFDIDMYQLGESGGYMGYAPPMQVVRRIRVLAMSPSASSFGPTGPDTMDGLEQRRSCRQEPCSRHDALVWCHNQRQVLFRNGARKSLCGGGRD